MPAPELAKSANFPNCFEGRRIPSWTVVDPDLRNQSRHNRNKWGVRPSGLAVRLVRKTAPCGANKMAPCGAVNVVRAAGLEPARASRPNGFSSHFGFRRRHLAFVVWTIPSPWRRRVRCCPSSLYTFPSWGLARDCQRRFPRIWAVLRQQFLAGHSMA